MSEDLKEKNNILNFFIYEDLDKILVLVVNNLAIQL